MRRHGPAAGHRVEEAAQLEHEGVLPPQHVAGRPPAVGVHERPAAVDHQLVQPLEVERQRALGPVDLPREAVQVRGGEARGLDRADRAALEGDRGRDRVVHLPAGHEGRHLRGHVVDLPDQVARQVHHVRGQVAQRPAARERGVEAPHAFACRVGAPRLPVDAAEVAHLPQVAGLEHLAGAAHGRHEAVVEGAHVHDVRLAHRGEHLRGPARRPAPAASRRPRACRRARPRSRGSAWRWFGKQVLHDLHVGVGHHLLPSRRVALEAEALGELAPRRLVAPRHRHQAGADRRRARHVAERLQRVGVRAAHERVTEHSDAGRFHSTNLSARRSIS